ncbi:Uncharacterised protein [Shigella sonnei]|nr:Uncharacterised protein [Shigella sonnei]CSG33052.1 Uncharacterised protein [Shigella sonnei]CSG40287.1 Uncharacterised protein [Shigella sonnei]CSH41345.1 Uncharacterised protein [Shigella sonnei]CSP29259.1 Uncharacterised protein [Shigella sonnei]
MQLFFNANFRRPWARGLATNVNDRRASVDHQIRMFHRIYQRVMRATIRKGIRRDVEDPHYVRMAKVQ